MHELVRGTAMMFWNRKFVLYLAFLIVAPGSGWAQKVPVDQIPKLIMFKEAVDYRETLRAGVLAPDKIEYEGLPARVNQLEPALVKVLGQDYTVWETEQHRSREEQWAYLRNLFPKHDDSMHFYIFSEIYYQLQLSGWFKVYEWTISDIKIRAFLMRPTESESARVWLLHLSCEPTQKGNVSYVESESMVLIRQGECGVIWDVKTNIVSIK